MKTIADKLVRNKMWKLIEYISVFCLTMVLSMGCGQPNLDEPKVRDKILAEAIDAETFQTRLAPSGEELRYAPNQERPYVGWVKDGTELYQYQNGKPNGLYIKWYGNGQKKVEGTYKNGERDGFWTGWHENGQKAGEVTFLNGKMNVLWVEWYEDGQKKEEGTYKNGERDGLWTGWHENGQKAGERTFLNGTENGLVIEWDENGQEVSRETYKDGEVVE